MSSRVAHGYREAYVSSDEDGADSDMSNVSKASSFTLQESRGFCNAPCCCHITYVLLFLVYVVIFPLWGKWLVDAPMPFTFWHNNVPAFPLLPMKDFDFAPRNGSFASRKNSSLPDIEISPIPTENEACNYSCGVELTHFRSSLMNFPVEMTLQRADLSEVNAHTTYPVLMASEDFKHWQLVGDRRNAYPDPFWRSDSEVSGNTFMYTSEKCTTKRKDPFTSKGTYILGCVTWSPEGQEAVQKAESLTIDDVRTHCTLVGGSCGWPCGSTIPANRLPGCTVSGTIDPSALMNQTAEIQQLGTVQIQGCLSPLTEECTTSSLPMSEWKCHRCSVETLSTGSDATGDDPDSDDPDSDEDDDPNEFNLDTQPPYSESYY